MPSEKGLYKLYYYYYYYCYYYYYYYYYYYCYYYYYFMFFFGRANAIAAILDFESRVRLGREESATRGHSTWQLRLTEILALACPQKTSAL